MTDPTILFVKPGAVSADDKSALQGSGVIVVEIADPADAKFIRAGAELSGSALLLAASKAIQLSGYDVVKVEFAKAVCAAIDVALTPKPNP